MLLEQTFFALPEVLHGSGYQQQDYEAGVVAAFSLSLLQVLNGRNISNPIGCIQSEKLYRARGSYLTLANPRYLRADLFVDVTKMMVANKRLGQYGWRHHAWLEGKFLRSPSVPLHTHSGNKTNYVATFLADLVRLALLVPETATDPSKAARYFLHVYDQPPEYYLTFRKRSWCKQLCSPGEQTLTLNAFASEPASVKRLLGSLDDLSLTLSVTNFAAAPISTNHLPLYWCFLTRIDGISANLQDHTYEVRADRSIGVSSPAAIDSIAAYVAENLQIAPTSKEQEAPADQIEAEEDLDQVGATGDD